MKIEKRPCRRLMIGLGILVLRVVLPAQEAVIEFGTERWTTANGRVVDFLGRKAFMGTASLKNVEFENGVIEVDIAASTDRARSYPGITFRIQPDGKWERFYIRPHRSALYGDVLQYVASFNSVDSWQFYNGYGATAQAVIQVNEWIHVKIEVSGSQARIFLGNAAQPALILPWLKHGRSRGGLGVMGPADGTAYFSNFSYRSEEGLRFDNPPPVDTVPGIIRDWKISKPFPALKIDLESPPEAQNLGDLAWANLAGEPSGLVDISRLYPRNNAVDVVFAKAVIHSERDDVRRFDIGYSDIITVFLNGRPVFSGNSQYQGRDSSFLGIAGWFDSIFLPLRKGENDLTLAVAEISGGWGFMVRDGRAIFATSGVAQAWETPQLLSVPESAAYDPVRACLFVSNYDPYNPSGTEGKQAIAKLGLDGKIENLDWVSGLSNPAGLCLVGDRLYAVERRSIAEIDIPQAKILNRFPLPGAVFPNDIAAGPEGTLYVSDSNRATIFKWTAGKAEEWIRDPRLARCNGIIVDGSVLIVGTNIDGCLKSIDLQTKEIKTIAPLGQGIIDGIVRVAEGIYLVSHNEGRLFRVSAGGGTEKLLDLTVVGRPIADFAYLGDKGLIVFPTFTGNRVAAYTLKLSTILSD